MMVEVMRLMARVIPLIFVVWGGGGGGRGMLSGGLRCSLLFARVQVNRGVYSQYNSFIFILLSSRGHFIYRVNIALGRGSHIDVP